MMEKVNLPEKFEMFTEHWSSKIVGELTKVSVSGEDVIVQGPSLENVSQTAANIESSTKVKQKDQRVFLDGLYIYQG